MKKNRLLSIIFNAAQSLWKGLHVRSSMSFRLDTPFSERLLHGIAKASRKRTEEAATNDGSLVVKVGGEVKEGRAKELLKALPAINNPGQ